MNPLPNPSLVNLAVIVSTLEEAAVAQQAIAAFRAGKLPKPSANALAPTSGEVSNAVAEMSHVLSNPPLNDIERIILRYLYECGPGVLATVDNIAAAAIAGGFAGEDEAHNRVTANLGQISWRIKNGVTPQLYASKTQPIGLLITRLKIENKVRMRLTPEGREAVKAALNL